MNLNEDFISIQGIFLSIEKSAGRLTKIRYKGGNESIISNIITELQKFLTTKNYLKNKCVNNVFDNQLKEIVLFLILNTDLQNCINDPENEHLMNIMPQLSTCIIANTIIGLGLCDHYCKVLEKFPLEIIEELVIEIVPCLRKCVPSIHLHNAFAFLRLFVSKISSSTNKDAENADKLTDHAAQILLHLTALHGPPENIKIDSVYVNIGYTMLNLLDLLLTCDEKNTMLTRLVEKLLKTCCSIMMAVTLDVFCCWAEIEDDGQVLQSLIAGKSYMLIEKYQKYPPAKELIGMLGSIAQKPKTIHELIFQANPKTIIRMINKADVNQKLWLRALITSQLFKCKESMKCVSRWAHLCSSDDVSRILSLSAHIKDPEVKKLVIECASTLELNDLVTVTTRHFYESGISNLNDDIQQQIVLLFNKIKDTNVDEEFSKELILLLLQNPEQTLTHIFAESLKNSFYLYSIKNSLGFIKEVASVNNIGIKVLTQKINNHKPSETNYKNYTELLNALLERNFFSIEMAVTVILLPVLQTAGKNYELIKCGLEILSNLNGHVIFKEETKCFYLFLFETMKNFRCKFVEFDSAKQEVVKACVGLIEKYSEINQHTDETIKCEEDMFVAFYKRKLFDGNSNYTLFEYLFNCDLQNHSEVVTHMIKIMPLCVTQEWLRISLELIDICGVGTVKCVEIFCDTLILLCHLVDSQQTKTQEVNSMISALKYNLQNFGIAIKERVQSRLQSLEDDIAVTKTICRLLKHLPSTGNLKSEEGLSLASLLSDISLSSLKTNKKFACLVYSIKEPHICQMLAQKILKQ